MAHYEFAITQISGKESTKENTNWKLIFKENHSGQNIRVLSFRDISNVLQNSSVRSLNKIPQEDPGASYLQIPLHNELQMVFYIKHKDLWTKVKATFSLEKSKLRIEPVSNVLFLNKAIVDQLLNCFALERGNTITFWYEPKKGGSASRVKPISVID
ncbi:hypothetical protein [Falsibacillus pallidus]|uniref:Uncharacterized protein n=1 Tax=Falsibacillus pallidus TaxID=493781 RepID=A0A370G882_9BACI|nr:hypothetical protein [Falsibacillus pallidus]RDI39991.1 hypothetical protein DFR59_11312 [Falsibacillus pallidus]